MYNIALRFRAQDLSSDTDFYDYEIDQMSVKTVQKTQIDIVERGYHRLTKIGEKYKVIKVRFNFERDATDTLTKLETIYNSTTANYFHPNIFILFYRYAIDVETVSCPVQMMRDQMKWDYSFGEKLSTPIEIEFIETRPYNLGVGMIQFPMIQTLGNGT